MTLLCLFLNASETANTNNTETNLQEILLLCPFFGGSKDVRKKFITDPNVNDVVKIGLLGAFLEKIKENLFARYAADSVNSQDIKSCQEIQKILLNTEQINVVKQITDDKLRTNYQKKLEALYRLLPVFFATKNVTELSAAYAAADFQNLDQLVELFGGNKAKDKNATTMDEEQQFLTNIKSCIKKFIDERKGKQVQIEELSKEIREEIITKTTGVKTPDQKIVRSTLESMDKIAELSGPFEIIEKSEKMPAVRLCAPARSSRTVSVVKYFLAGATGAGATVLAKTASERKKAVVVVED